MSLPNFHPQPETERRVRQIVEDEAKPGWFENLGLTYFRRLSKKEGPQKAASTDKEMATRVRRATAFGFLIAFVIGGISAGGSVWVEELFDESACDVMLSAPCLTKYGWVAVATLLLTAVEFAVLFWVSILTVYRIAQVTGHSHPDPGDLFSTQVPQLLSRAALEIPDPIRRILGIDPLKRVSKKRLLVLGFLYKLKVMASNVLAKLVLRRVFGKSALRVSTAYISVPVTGLWNAVVVWKVAREARLRLVGNLLARQLTEREFTQEKLARLSPAGRFACLQAVGNSIVLTQNFHPNMVVLLAYLSAMFEFEEGQPLDDWEPFLENLSGLAEHERNFVLDLLCIAAAFDGKLSKLERQTLGQAFQEHSAVYFERILRLKNHMVAGRLFAALEECKIDFEAG